MILHKHDTCCFVSGTHSFQDPRHDKGTRKRTLVPCSTFALDLQFSADERSSFAHAAQATPGELSDPDPLPSSETSTRSSRPYPS